MITLLIFISVAVSTGLYFLSVRRFKKNGLFEIFIWIIGVISALFFLFGNDLLTILSVDEKPQVVLESTNKNESADWYV